MAIIMFSFNDEIQEIDTEGFQVVSGSYFRTVQRFNEPSCTLWFNSISFSKASLNVLNGCERVRIEVNINKKGILIVPVTAKDKDGVKWTKNKKDPIPRKIDCTAFTKQLFDSWGWDRDYVYKAYGRIVTTDNKVMLLFEFSKPEKWELKDKSRIK